MEAQPSFSNLTRTHFPIETVSLTLNLMLLSYKQTVTHAQQTEEVRISPMHEQTEFILCTSIHLF